MAKYAGSAWNNEHNLVFTNAMGDFLSHRTVYDCFKRIVKTIGMEDMRFHDLRHTFATHALTSGVDAKTLSGILGHTKTSFTLDTYTHVTGDMHRKASGIVSEFMNDFVVKE